MKLQNKARIDFNPSPDRQLRSRIRRALHAQGYAVLNAIRIEVHQGEVYLEGTVTSYFMKQMAQVLILTFDEVRKVHNLLRVDAPESQSEVKLFSDQDHSLEDISRKVSQTDQCERPENVDVSSEII